MLISNPQQESFYNAMVDIKTDISILAVPIRCSLTKEILGVFEVINTRGIEGMSITGSSTLGIRDYEI